MDGAFDLTREYSCTLVGAGMKILVVEDDEDVRSALLKELQASGFIVETAADGAEGLYQAENWDYDAIVLDVMMPDTDGWEFLKRIRRMKKTPILMLTALGELDDRIRGLNTGADDYLPKPYEPVELIARLRALVRRSAGQAENIISLGRVTIDTESQSITLDDQPVKLSLSQYRIVEQLAFQAGKLVTRKALCEALLIEDEEDFSNVLDVQIYNIRKKLGRDFLQNRRGAGYIIPMP